MEQDRSSIHKKLARVRRPRVQITYDVETYGAVGQRTLPFVVGVLADFSKTSTSRMPLKERKTIGVDIDCFSEVMARVRPVLRLAVDEIPVTLEFSSLRDFTPPALISRVPMLARIWQLRSSLLSGGYREDTEVTGLLRTHGFESLIPTQGETSASLVVEHLDRLLAERLDSIINYPDFRALESTWRGLWYLVVQSETGPDLRIEILDVSKKALFRDLDRSVSYDQSNIFKQLYEERFGTFGADPIGVVVGGYEFSQHPEDIRLIRLLSEVAAAMHAPFVAAASAEMFGLDDYAQITAMRDLAKVFQTSEYAAWRSFRDTEDARWVVLTVPNILLRTPVHYRTAQPYPYTYVQDAGQSTALLWGNAAFALAACMTRAFAAEYWVSNIQGIEGGRVENLPVANILLDSATQAKVCTSVRIDDRLERALHDGGFAALMQSREGDEAMFLTAPSCQRPREYDSEEATGNARVLTQLPTVMICARFAQYLMVISRDQVGSFKERSDYERFLNRWLAQYVSHDPVDNEGQRAKYPLREASVSVSEMPGSPGYYQAMLYLRPQYGVGGLSVSLRVPVLLSAKA